MYEFSKVYLAFLMKSIRKYQKNNTETFSILMNHGAPKLVAKYARRIIEEHNGISSTNITPRSKVYELMEELAKYLPNEYREKFV